VIEARRPRRAVRPGRLYVDVRAALNLVGGLIKYLSLAFAFPIAIAIGYGESTWPFVAAAAIAAAGGQGLQVACRGAGPVGVREGFLVISTVWLLVPAVGALPYVFAGEEELAHPVGAYFEAMSGFSTTGSSVVTDVAELSHSIAMWRQFTIWVGGVGIIVLALAILPRLRVGGRQLLEVELPGPEVDLRTTIRETAQRFLVLYLAITVAEIAVLSVIAWTGLDDRMSFYEAVAHTFATLGTGGFSTRPESIAAFGGASQWAIAFFMIAAGTNYALMYLAFVRRRFVEFARDDEFRLYLGLLALASVVLLVELLRADIAHGEEVVRDAVFQTASIMTTTGFASTNFDTWPVLAAVTLVGLMFFGASAGSTTGSVKVVRHVLIGRILRRELVQTVHPELVVPIRLNRVIVDERTLRAVVVFVLLYVGCFALGALLLVADASRVGLDLTAFDAIAAAATTLSNCGPGFGFAGPFGNFDPFSDVSKGLMIVLMWLGRLEIIPVAVLLTRSYWRG
jgi:trk system potassium uptake protein TrkH